MIKVIFEDEYLLVAEKQPKLLVVPAPDKNTNMTSLLSQQLRKRIYPCHRLDFDTSGVIIFAKALEVRGLIMNQFRNSQIIKKYIAFIQGKLNKNLTIKSNIKAPGKRKKLAITEIKILKVANFFTIVEVTPITGRTNQIRIHCAEIKHPIIGDRKYSVAKDYPLKFKRTCLHAKNITFCHPVTNKQLKISSELPQDMLNFLSNQNIAYHFANPSFELRD